MGIHVDTCQGEYHQICNFILSHSKARLGQIMKDLVGEAESGTWNPNQQVCGGQAPMQGLHKLLFEKSFEILGYIFNPAKCKTACRNDAMCEQRMVERSEDLPQQRCTMENQNAEECWTNSTAYSVSGAKTGPGAERPWTESKVGRRKLGGVVQIQRLRLREPAC